MFEDFQLDRNIPLPAYWQIQEYIRRTIDSGRLEPGTRLPSEMELSRLLGVSPMTARQAFSTLVADGLLIRRQGRGTFVAEPHHGDKGIALIFQDFHGDDYYTSPIIAGVKEWCDAETLELSIHLSGDRSLGTPENRTIRRMIEEHRYRGVIINGRVDREGFELLEKHRLPFVFIDCDYRREKVCSVLIDDAAAVAGMLERMIAAGFTRIGLLAGPLSLDTDPTVRRGNKAAATCRRVLTGHGLPFAAGLVRHGEADRAADLARELLACPERPQAILTTGDAYAAAVRRTAEECGLNVPDDLAVWNYNDSPDVFWPGCRKPLREMGLQAGRMLGERLAGRMPQPPIRLLPPLSC